MNTPLTLLSSALKTEATCATETSATTSKSVPCKAKRAESALFLWLLGKKCGDVTQDPKF
jgi:hypothetical protein